MRQIVTCLLFHSYPYAVANNLEPSLYQNNEEVAYIYDWEVASLERLKVFLVLLTIVTHGKLNIL